MHLFFGVAWVIFAIFALNNIKALSWLDYGYFLLSIIYFSQFFYEYRNQYLTIENGSIRKNSFLGKTVELNKITEIKKFAGDYMLKTDSLEFKINTELIDEYSLMDLNKILEKIDLPANKTPFAKPAYL